jgi:hypothetical protein
VGHLHLEHGGKQSIVLELNIHVGIFLKKRTVTKL